MLKTHENFYTTNGKRLILIVDDEEINRELLNLVLKDEYDMLFAEDGESALNIIREKKDVLSLIMLDLLMPGIHGLEVIKILKGDPDLCNIPIIVLTADQEAEVTSLRLGASDFIPKPYPKKEVILARIVRSIELSEDRDIITSTERDHLTGLYNREYFYRYAEQFDQHHKDMEMDAIVVDVHHFRMINERYGKAYGDDVLRKIGEKVRDMVRDSGGIVCRREADTFLVYCPHRDDYEAIIENASIGLAGSNISSNRVRLRMGVYSNVDKKIEIERRFDRAKMAADTIRSNFMRSIALYDNKLHESEIYAERLLEDFHEAIKNREFIVYYQPKFDITTEIPVLSSAEALVRWDHRELGLISPGVFIPLLEDNGLIQELDHYVWNMAAAQIRDWADRLGIIVPVSVNVSRIDMYDPNLIPVFQDILEQYGLSAGDLLLEITESAYTQDSAQIISTVNKLRELGFRIEMDDFGTGYSSLNMISSLPIDALKLDMKFIRNAFRDGRDTRLIEVIVDIADYLGVPVIAEGVETLEQLDALRALHVDLVQGYYFSKPVPPSDYEVFMQKKKEMTDASKPERSPFDKSASSDRASVSTSIVHALTSGFEVIYYVDTNNGQYVQFSSQGRYEDLQIERSGQDFFSDTERNIPKVIFAEDQARVSLSMTKDALLSQLIGGRSFSMIYRIMIGGRPVYYNLRAVNASARDDHHIVIGVSNVDEQIHQANDTAELIDRNNAFFTIAQALSSDFESIYYVDTVTDEYTEFTAQGAYENLQIELSGSDFFNECQKNLPLVVYEEDLNMISSAIQKDTLLEALDERPIYSLVYRLMIEGKPTYYRIKIVKAEDGRHLVFGIANIEAQMVREHALEMSRQNSITYASIAQALAADYFSIYYVDTETDHFVEFSAHDGYQELGIEKGGEDFFNLSRRNILRVVHPDDHDMILTAFTKEKLLAEMEKTGTFTLKYRLMFGDEPQYVSMKATHMADRNDSHIVIGVNSIDAQIRRERELNAAREKANRDALTGVKSKHAYDESSARINAEIENGKSVPFAVAVCDVNGLKTVNDTLGHKAGDQLILDATRIICNIFKHSPVFRIGGDEFVAILRGSDYENRDELAAAMLASNETGKESGGVIIACGCSEWIPGKDNTFEAVFERADAAMYDNKAMLKAN